MASFKSLGTYGPSALLRLEAEGILPADPPPSAYTWLHYPAVGRIGSFDEEELLYTSEVVVWSREGAVQKIFHFDAEQEPVRQALFVNFGDDANSAASKRSARSKGSHAPLSPTLTIRKRPTEEQAKPLKNPGKNTWAYAEQENSTASSSCTDDQRALVVLLTTQLHIFFLHGGTHLVPLPFKVSAIFALPSGLAVQREILEEESPHSSQIPSITPYNSFAFSQLTASFVGPSQTQELSSSSPVIQKMLSKMFNSHNTQRAPAPPAHFYLRDPIADFEPLGESTEPENRPAKTSGSGARKLDQHERLIYVSERDEISDETKNPEGARLRLAVTANPTTGYYSIWKFSEQRRRQRKRGVRDSSSAGISGKDKLRASFGPATGATTATARHSVGVNDSFGQKRASFRDHGGIHDETDIASQLDPAFENPGAPNRSSRRISSLIARSEAHGGRDNANPPDIAPAQSQTGGSKRGPSFGGHSSRRSFNSVGKDDRRTLTGSQTELGNLTDDDESMAGMDEDDVQRERQAGLSLSSLADEKRLVLSKIFTLYDATLRNKDRSYKSLLSSHRIFTLERPATSETQFDNRQIVVYLMSHLSNSLYTVYLDAASARTSKQPAPPGGPYNISVERFTTVPSIKDACLVNEGAFSRIIAVRTDQGNEPELSLSSPWSPELLFNLPLKMFTTNPDQIDMEGAVRKHRDEEFRRVFCSRPEKICSLAACAAPGQFCVQDPENVCHRIQILLAPSNPLVEQALLISEHALPLPAKGAASSLKQDGVLLRVWWEAMKLIADKYTDMDEIEWRAFIATVFSLYLPFQEIPKDAKPAQTRRKKGNVRSSSGADQDFESFEEIMALECVNGSAIPPWLQEESWKWTLETDTLSELSRSWSPITKRSASSSDDGVSPGFFRKRSLLIECLEVARQFYLSDAGAAAFGGNGYLPVASHLPMKQRRTAIRNVFMALHLFREELKLDVTAASRLHAMTPVLAQIGTWLDWDRWSCRSAAFYTLESAEMDRWTFDLSKLHGAHEFPQTCDPPSIFQHIEDTCNGQLGLRFTTLEAITGENRSTKALDIVTRRATPRTALLLGLFQFQDSGPESYIRIIGDSMLTPQILETLPEGIAVSLRSVIVSCQANPVASFPPRVLDLIDRPDLSLLADLETELLPRSKPVHQTSHEAVRDVNAMCRSSFETEASNSEGSAEEDRSLITKLIFSQDQRFGEAATILHPLKHAVAKCVPEPDWSDTDLLEAQQELAKVVASRTLSVSPGRAMLYYNARFPLLTEKFPIHGFSLSCLMKPGNTTVTADKNIYTEEKVSWAFFHAGVGAGLSISKDAEGIDTSWISYNKPTDLGNRHAGFLLALGLNGHLKSIAKWVAFKYLTPKHTMTSIGLLLGLAASYLGTMDTLITRLLSVHVVRMLPVGAAEMNLSPLTQTTGIMGIGLVYCNTQHRRMSEVMLSEIESIEQEDTINPMENLRDEGYRLAAGFALGFINLSQGGNLKGMRDMHIVERLLVLAIATKRVGLVHILDKATAAAVVAVALIFMKTGNHAVAKKIDIPDTVHQFEYVRPDLFLLRTVARHLIMWDRISPTFTWMREQLPRSFRGLYKLNRAVGLRSDQLPLFHIVAGLCLSIGLRYAGSARTDVRDLLTHYLDCFMKIVSLLGTTYDEKLARIGIRNCQDAVALAAASVMAGTGDVPLLKRFRILHGRTDIETHYGSHLAAHQAIGVLFLGGGTHTFNTSNLGVASLLCAFYPLFPTSVLDNRCHLQAFRHFWVFAAEPRCLIVRSVETSRPMSMDITISMRSGDTRHCIAPCLLPELHRIARITSNDSRFWPVSLDFAGDPQHLAAFRRHQSLYVCRRSTYNQSLSVFSATMRTLNERQMLFQRRHDAFEWLFGLSALSGLDYATRSLILPVESSGSASGAGGALLLGASRSTAVDDRLALEWGCLTSSRAERLWSLRVLFAWDDKMRRVGNNEITWLGADVISLLRAKVALAGRQQAH